MSWECKYRSGDACTKLGVTCDPGRRGCVLHGKVYFPFKPEKNTPSMNRDGSAAGSTTANDAEVDQSAPEQGADGE